MNATVERRAECRQESLNFIDFIVVDEHGQTLGQSMGRTLDMSEKGLQVECYESLAAGQTLMLTMGLQQDLVALQGKVVRSRRGPDGQLFTGIRFEGADRRNLEVLGRYLQSVKTH